MPTPLIESTFRLKLLTYQFLFIDLIHFSVKVINIPVSILYGTALTNILPILFLYLNTVTVTTGAFEP